MCGIVGIFNDNNAESKVKKALALLKNRGNDGSDYIKVKEDCFLGHTLHAIVNKVLQPLQQQGTITANCEIYNWKELAEKYDIEAKNDADLLLKLLDKTYLFSTIRSKSNKMTSRASRGVVPYGDAAPSFFTTEISKVLNKYDKTNIEHFTQLIQELDGVYAFGYFSQDTLILARDILGIKPLWYSFTTDSLAFASEKKVLEQLGFLSIEELNPRQVINYNIKNKTIQIINRPFFNLLPEHTASYSTIKKSTASLLDQAIQKRIPEKKFGLLFSGGVDSTFLAKYLLDNHHQFTCYTAAVDSQTPAADLISAQKAAQELGLNLKIKKIKEAEIPTYLKKIVPLIEDSNVVKVGVALTFYVACEMAKEDGCKVIFSGLGSEEIFAGYERHKNSQNINQECVSGLLKMYERDLYRDDVITMDNHLELRLPFLDKKLVAYALKIPSEYKLKNEQNKYVLREIAEEQGLPKEFAFRKKTAAQYGSRFDNALGKLAKKNKFSSKSAYLRTFYPTHNLKLGVLFSGGKDSTYAAYVMQKQNYQLSCLITLKSENPSSYMFHTPAIDLTELQAKAMGIPIVFQQTSGKKEEELADLQKALSRAKQQYVLDGIITGAIFSTYQRNRIENICDKVGLKIFSPLWHKPQSQELKELLQSGFHFMLTSIAAEGLDRDWLRKAITEKEVKKLLELEQKIGFHPAGEGGEYESLVVDCPLFKQRLVIEEVEIVEENKYTAHLIIKKAKLEQKHK
ncbi:diphthine--ammonia ligase [Candidatus Woesearchaeota archaeon]|nr:diphthine--ammonia ligase [Candidatus Woesearchaeota archaeon]